jgi:hypothetical protein
MIAKKLQKKLAESLKHFQKSRFENVSILMNELDASRSEFDKARLSELLKFQSLFLLGHLLGHSTLHSLLVTVGLPIGVYEKQYRKLCKQLTHSHIHKVYEFIFEKSILATLSQLSQLSASSWSKACVTAVMDASVFKHLRSGEDPSGYHGSWFSGQNRCVVSGYKVHTIGLVIHGIFHPLYYDFEHPLKDKSLENAQKACKKAFAFWKKQDLKWYKWYQKTAESLKRAPNAKPKAASQNLQTVLETAKAQAFAVLGTARQQVKAFETVAGQHDLAAAVACRLLNRLSEFWQTSRKTCPNLPEKLFLSVDNGYNQVEVLQCCDKNAFILLCVPKKTELFKIGSTFAQSLEKWIDLEYQVREASFLAAQKQSNQSSEPFTWRVKATYIVKEIQVTLLFFRLNRSDNVSVVYCPDTHDPTIFAKTMRHHWFCRTQIEQFFRTVKPILKIQEAKSQFFFEFDIKIGRFFWVALDAQYLTRMIRKKCKKLRKVGFKQLIKHFIFNVNPLEILADFESFDFSLKESN